LCFEACLLGANQKSGEEWGQKLRDAGANLGSLSPEFAAKGGLVERILVGEPDFDQQDHLSEQLEQALLAFSSEMEALVDQC